MYSIPAEIKAIASITARKYDGRKKASNMPQPKDNMIYPIALYSPFF